ncbi:MAG: hypothetical protein RI967_2097, partial [Planctomycetota bacterium]
MRPTSRRSSRPTRRSTLRGSLAALALLAAAPSGALADDTRLADRFTALSTRAAAGDA